MLSEQGRRAIACAEWQLLDLGHRLDVASTIGVLRIPFQTPDDYRQGAMRYALLCEIDPDPASPGGFEAVALLFWIQRYETAHVAPSMHGH